MIRALLLFSLILSAAGCATSGAGGTAESERAYVVVKNENLVAYTILVNGARIGRVGPNTTQQLPLTGIATGAPVQFSARAGSGATVSWNPIAVRPGGSVSLTIRYRPGSGAR